VDGILNIDKPAGITSFGVVALVRRLCKQKQVGHAGTLDPFATGVLPVCLGQSTRITEYLQRLHKTYLAVIRLGVVTDTYDASGRILRQCDASSVSREGLSAVLGRFTGTIAQTPPMFSALKQQGKPLYLAARQGLEFDRPTRPVTIYRLELKEWQPSLATVEVECSKGTYIRSLAYDIGQILGYGAHLASLVRLSYGPFKIADAINPPRLEEAVKQGKWEELVSPMDIVLQDWPAFTVVAGAEKDIRDGKPQIFASAAAAPAGGTAARVYSPEGRFLAIVLYDPDTDRWLPEKVFIHSDNTPGS
jgi:tRNA pseudouridine55 synthase